jgi:hypothetical protein
VGQFGIGLNTLTFGPRHNIQATIGRHPLCLDRWPEFIDELHEIFNRSRRNPNTQTK